MDKDKLKRTLIFSIALIFMFLIFFNLSNFVNNHNEICEERGWDGSVNTINNLGEEYKIKCNKPKESEAITDVLNSMFFRNNGGLQ